jgi:hypothetical protein
VRPGWLLLARALECPRVPSARLQSRILEQSASKPATWGAVPHQIPIQRGSNATLLGRVQAVKLIRHNFSGGPGVAPVVAIYIIA